MRGFTPMLEADLVLEPEDIIFDEKTGDISVPIDVFDTEEESAYLNIVFTDEAGDIIHQYKIIDKTDDYIHLEYIGG